MKRKNKIKAIVALAVALAFVMPGAFANVDTIGVTSNSENTGDIENIVEISTNSDTTGNAALTLPVHNLDTGLDYATIQGAIDAVETLDGHTIYVDNGVYPENVVVTKQLDLVGESKEGVIVDGGGVAEVIQITVSDVSVDSFTTTNAMVGIMVIFSSTDFEHINITNCISHGNQVHGIFTMGSYWMRNSVIKNCEVYSNMNGMDLSHLETCTISECYIHDNDCGINMLGSSLDNRIYHNNFIGNTLNAKPLSSAQGAIWDDGSEGNYWDDYEEKYPEAGNDGTVWDTPYILDADDKDNYPLVNLWTPPPEIMYILNITIDPIAGGTVNTVPEPEPDGYAEDTEVTLTPSASIGWSFVDWSGDDSISVVDNKINMTKDMNVTATFTQLDYTLTTTTSGAGYGVINRDNPGPVYHYNDVVQLTAVPNAGSEFTQWTGNITGAINPDNVTITGNMNVDAEFTLEEYTLNIGIDPIESGSSVDRSLDGPYNYNDEVTLTPVAATGWSFAGWSGPDGGLIVDNKIIMTKNMEVTATFTKGWELPMIFTGDLLGVDTVVFGEKGDASDGIDTMDVPKPPAPGAPYIYAYIEHDLPGTSHDILWEEYRLYNASNDLQIWDLVVETDTTGGSGHETVEVNITWDKDVLATETQYEHIDLYDVLSGELLEDMTTVETYEFAADSGMANHFQIICSDNHAPVANDDLDYSTYEAHELNVAADGVLGNDVDVDGDTLTAVVPPETDVSDGTLTLYADGSFDYMPDPGFFGPDNFTYKAYDGALYSNIATVEIEVLELNHIDIQDGWNLISMPVGEPIVKTDILVRFGGSDRSWNAAIGTIIEDPTFGWNSGMYTNEMTLVPGEGYWMWSHEICELLIPSNAIADNHITNLDVEWNLVGIPYDTPLLKTDINVYYNGHLYTWDEATTDNNPTGEPIILGFVFGWDRASQNYALLTDTFMPGFGYWMYAFHGCALKKVV